MYRMQHRTYSGIVLSWHARSWPSLYLNTEFLLCMVRSAWSDQPPPLHSSQSSSKDTSLHSLLMAYNQRYNVPSGVSDSSLRQWNIRRRYINSWLIDWSIDWLIESVVHISRQKNWKLNANCRLTTYMRDWNRPIAIFFLTLDLTSSMLALLTSAISTRLTVISRVSTVQCAATGVNMASITAVTLWANQRWDTHFAQVGTTLPNRRLLFAAITVYFMLSLFIVLQFCIPAARVTILYSGCYCSSLIWLWRT